MTSTTSASLWRCSNFGSEEHRDALRDLMTVHGLSWRAARWARRYGLDSGMWLEFSEPQRVAWSKPHEFDDMERATAKVRQSLVQRETIVVVGDYDVDGVAASVILCDALERLGAVWHVILPHRVHDGYGLSTDIVLRAADLGARLLITVDNGIVATEAVEEAKVRGIDVIITDHHEPLEHLPQHAHSIIHWQRSQDADRLAILSGAAVAWKLSQALLENVMEVPSWYMGLAALAALADIMPMVGENRRIVRQGLVELARWNAPGWVALCDVAQVDRHHLTETNVLWHITPRVNAAGRMDSAMVAFELFFAKDALQATRLAKSVEGLNQSRRADTKAAMEDLVEWFDTDSSTGQQGVVVAGPWPLGIVGIVAAKLSEHLGRPAIVLSDDGSASLKGSGRAPSGFPLHAAMRQCEPWLERFGGHDGAVGCAVTRTCLSEFTEAFSQACVTTEPSAKSSHGQVFSFGNAPIHLPLADDWLSLSEIDESLLANLDMFRPHGREVDELTFFLGPMKVEAVTAVGDGRHVRLKVREEKQTADIMWFNVPDQGRADLLDAWVAAVVHVERNRWRGTVSIQLRADAIIPLHNPVTRQEFAIVFRTLKRDGTIRLVDVQRCLPEQPEPARDMVLRVFEELGFASVQDGAYHVNEILRPLDLRESSHYQAHLLSTMCPLSLDTHHR